MSRLNGQQKIIMDAAGQAQEMRELLAEQQSQFFRSYHMGVVKDVYVGLLVPMVHAGQYVDHAEIASQAKHAGDALMIHLGFMQPPAAPSEG